MNSYILFAGGIILGILISLTLVQYDGHSTAATVPSASVGPTGPLLIPSATAVAEVIPPSPIGKLTMPDVMKPSAVSRELSKEVLLSKDQQAITAMRSKKDAIVWTPGKESSLDKYKKDAAVAQAAMLPQQPQHSPQQQTDGAPTEMETKKQLKQLQRLHKQELRAHVPVIPQGILNNTSGSQMPPRA